MIANEDAWSDLLPDRSPVLETMVSLTSYDELLALLRYRPADIASVFVFCTVHTIMTARRDASLALALTEADVVSPDGVPLVWALRKTRDPQQTRVYGPDLMELALPFGVPLGWRHWFLGSTEDTLARLRTRAQAIAPGIVIAGTTSPPFRALRIDEEDEIVDRVLEGGTDLLWIGMGMPKQELLAQRLRSRLPGVRVLAVGAAFDFLAGTVPQAPDWMQDRGLEWLYRVWREPRRLWRRYLFNNPAFLVLLGHQLYVHRKAERRLER